MIAVGVTPSNDGYAHTRGPGGTGLFVVATANIGTAGVLTARARLFDATTPITATVCETNPAPSACMAPPAPTVTRIVNQNENATWAVFLQASAKVVADPARNRVALEFVDASGVVRGSTSTAVTTE